MNFQLLLACNDQASLFEKTQSLITALGYHHWLYTVRACLGDAPQGERTFHNFDSEMWKAYCECEIHEDTVIAGLPKGELIPRVWLLTEASQQKRCEDPAADRLYRCVFEKGIRGGICIPIHGQGNVMGTLTLASRMPTTEHRLNNGVGIALLLSKYLHQAYVHLLGRQTYQGGPQLSRREIECLTWASKGKTTWEISKVLAISEHTVNFHLKNANLKLGTINRRQAVARSIQMGYLAA